VSSKDGMRILHFLDLAPPHKQRLPNRIDWRAFTNALLPHGSHWFARANVVEKFGVAYITASVFWHIYRWCAVSNWSPKKIKENRTRYSIFKDTGKNETATDGSLN
jgi:hypothetical protein